MIRARPRENSTRVPARKNPFQLVSSPITPAHSTRLASAGEEKADRKAVAVGSLSSTSDCHGVTIPAVDTNEVRTQNSGDDEQQEAQADLGSAAEFQPATQQGEHQALGYIAESRA